MLLITYSSLWSHIRASQFKCGQEYGWELSIIELTLESFFVHVLQYHCQELYQTRFSPFFFRPENHQSWRKLAILLAVWKVAKGRTRCWSGIGWTEVKSNWVPTAGGAWPPCETVSSPRLGVVSNPDYPYTEITWAKNGGLISYYVQLRLRLPQPHVRQIADWITDQNTISGLRSYLYWYHWEKQSSLRSTPNWVKKINQYDYI